jgi:hypothetical protein
MARFYSNENFPIEVVRALPDYGRLLKNIYTATIGDQAKTKDSLATYQQQKCKATLNF